MKVLKFIKDAILFVLLSVFFVFALTMTILLLNYNDFGLTQFGDNTFILITNEISNDEFEKGDLVIVEKRGLDKYNVGDTLFAYRIDSKRMIHVDQGIVGKVYPSENALAFDNGNTYGEEFIAGVPIKKYEDIGTFLSIVESKWGFLFIVLVPSFLIFLYEVYALIMEVKYGGLEDEDFDDEDDEKTVKKSSSSTKKSLSKEVEEDDETKPSKSKKSTTKTKATSSKTTSAKKKTTKSEDE